MKAWVIRISLYTVVLTSFGISSFLFFHAINQIKQCTFFIDPYCSSSTAYELKQYVQQNSDKSFSATIIKKLANQFPFVSESSLSLDPSGMMRCSIQLSQPLLVLNGEHVLLSNDTIASINIFDNSFVKSLPCITLSSQYCASDLPVLIKNIVRGIPSHLFDHYSISVIDPITIQLVDKQNPKIVIITDKESIKNFNVSTCHAIQEKEKTALEKKSKSQLVMDVRFNHQIIVHLQSGQGGVL